MSLGKFTCGILTGFALGLLFAPQKGRKTRKKVMDAAESWKNSLDNLFGKGENELDKITIVAPSLLATSAITDA